MQDSYAEKLQTVFGFNSVVVQLLVGRSMIWFCVGPLFWGALSDKVGLEIAGRNSQRWSNRHAVRSQAHSAHVLPLVHSKPTLSHTGMVRCSLASADVLDRRDLVKGCGVSTLFPDPGRALRRRSAPDLPVRVFVMTSLILTDAVSQCDPLRHVSAPSHSNLPMLTVPF